MSFGEAECCARRAAVSEAVIRAVPVFAGCKVLSQFLMASAALGICKRDRVVRVRYFARSLCTLRHLARSLITVHFANKELSK